MKYNGFKIGFEAGPYFHEATWAVSSLNNVLYPGDTVNSAHAPTWQLGSVFGFSIERRNFSIAYQYFRNGKVNSDNVPPIWSSTHMLFARFQF